MTMMGMEYLDTVVKDKNQNGKPELIGVDTNKDGRPDIIALVMTKMRMVTIDMLGIVDKDFDGKPDVIRR